uniref:Uncharacterized protein n=1 Tax=Oryza brachyantha TaxID=4533 RepID=J3MY23_ORYBR
MKENSQHMPFTDIPKVRKILAYFLSQDIIIRISDYVATTLINKFITDVIIAITSTTRRTSNRTSKLTYTLHTSNPTRNQTTNDQYTIIRCAQKQNRRVGKPSTVVTVLAFALAYTYVAPTAYVDHPVTFSSPDHTRLVGCSQNYHVSF